ncbi:MAG: metal ABC transporter ATP-binding protein [Actinobacteria bacterium]|nr:metal ABC transporter ATP-binding protein [Actinomycetota bacterium]
MTLTVRDLSVTYHNRPAIHSVAFDALSGSVTGIIGPNGAGKSTVLKAVMGLVRPDTGTVRVDGLPIDRVRDTIAYLPQRLALDWEYPAQVRDVVAMGRHAHRRFGRRRGRADHDAIASALDRVGLSELATRHIGELSGGQQQRMLVARALAQEASTLLLDEPFVGVDAATVALLSTLLMSLAADGACVVVVHHDLATTAQMCDHLVLLNQRIVSQGPTARVFTSEWLDRTYAVDPGASGTTASSWQAGRGS